MKPWFEKELTEADILKFPEPKAKVIRMPNVQSYPDFITGVQDLQANLKNGTISQETYDKLYADLIHRFMKKESFDTPWFIKEEIVSKSTDSAKYMAAVKTLLAKGGEIPFGQKGEIKMIVKPGTKLTNGLDTVIQGTINGKKDAYVAGKIHKDAVKGKDSERWNTGNVTEGIFGAGIYTALGLSKPITVLQLQTFLLTKLKGNGNTNKGRVRKTGDKISLMINLSPNNYKALTDPKVLKMLEKHTKSVVDYVNSEEITELDQMFQANRKIDNIQVIADGVSEEDVSKVDVYVKYNDGETRFERSVKTGEVKQFGQVSTGGAQDTLSREERFELQDDFWQTWNIDISNAQESFEDAEDFITAYDYSYNEAAKQFKAILKGTGNEEQVIQELVKTIQFHAYRDNPNAKMINFDEKGYVILDFTKLNAVIDKLDLTANFIRTTKKGDVRARPEVHITDTKGNVFLIFRLYVSKGKISNLIEKGPLLTKITKVKSNY